MQKHKHHSRAVERGKIYEFKNTKGQRVPGRYALVVSGVGREHDNVESVLILTDVHGSNRDVVSVRIKGITYYAHCGMVTYCGKYQFGKLIGDCDAVTMERINAKLPFELGLDAPERQDFEKLYYDTVALLEGNKTKKKEGKGDGEKTGWFSRMRQRLFRF